MVVSGGKGSLDPPLQNGKGSSQGSCRNAANEAQGGLGASFTVSIRRVDGSLKRLHPSDLTAGRFLEGGSNYSLTSPAEGDESGTGYPGRLPRLAQCLSTACPRHDIKRGATVHITINPFTGFVFETRLADTTTDGGSPRPV